ncbi:hypothetical protein EYM_03650 [Ignicoccus islandicus DSM 13165]|uniref:Uncharacterized protein n=1 Tax=Ignicoccus islandicus DSM 13165 TaxID=940295 RepID=A0A0U2MAW9_9CREN|nr:hypothetical protein [Ignicoccus islandicus]ALU12429.1 hypothetical protein EYM_03650 [Ignicoccus islandicus DSM 13165]
MCEPVYPAHLFVIIQSRYDNKFWIIKSNKEVIKKDIEGLISEFKDCYNSLRVSICPNEGKIIIWSKNGYNGIGIERADLLDENTWCNLSKFAHYVNDKLREPITPSMIDAAKEELLWLLGAHHSKSLNDLIIEV